MVSDQGLHCLLTDSSKIITRQPLNWKGTCPVVINRELGLNAQSKGYSFYDYMCMQAVKSLVRLL